MVRLALVFGAAWLSIGSPAAHRTHLPVILASEFFLLCILTLGAQIRLRLRGGAPPITLGEDCIDLPRHALSLRTTSIEYADIRSASLAGRGGAERVVIETTRRSFRFPRANFAQPDVLDRLRQALARRILAMPGGQKRWAAIEARHHLADRLASIWPWGTWAAVVAIAALFGVQTFLVQGIGDFGLIDLGGNAALLVRDGEWFRLVTASLLHENVRHLVGNALVLLLIGGILEPLIGRTIGRFQDRFARALLAAVRLGAGLCDRRRRLQLGWFAALQDYKILVAGAGLRDWPAHAGRSRQLAG